MNGTNQGGQQRDFRRRQGGNRSSAQVISYLGRTIDPGNRTGKTRQNYISRQKLRIKVQTGNISGSRGNNNPQSNPRSQSARNSNNQTSSRGNQALDRVYARVGDVRNPSKGTAADFQRYMSVLIDPIVQTRSARIPAYVPFPTAVTTIRLLTTFTANASGNFAVQFHPQMGTDAAFSQYLHILNNDSYNVGNNWIQNVTATSIFTRSMKITALQAFKLRVVGAGLTVRYTGALQAAAGTIYSAFVPKGATRGSALGVVDNGGAGFAQGLYYGFSPTALENQDYHHSELVAAGKTASCIWIPREDIDFDFMDYAAGRETSMCVIAGLGLPPGATMTAQIVIHYEMVPDPSDTVLETNTVAAVPGVMEQVANTINHNKAYVTSPEDGSPLGEALAGVFAQSVDYVVDKASDLMGKYTQKVLYGSAPVKWANPMSIEDLI